MKKSFVFWVERYFYAPSPTQKILSLLLLPLSFLYCGVMWLRYKLAQPHDFGVDITSVGNLVVGGSGKTPFVTALAKNTSNAAVILRGYGRNSKGLVVVKDKEQLLVDVEQSGDEAMIYAKKLPHCVVIVAENRKEGILKAKEMGVEKIFLDDAYSKHNIYKKDILLHVETPNSFCLPSGPYRERLWKGKDVTVYREGKDFVRKTTLLSPTEKMVLVTAIARPQRLEKYLPKVQAKYYFEDHHPYTKKELEEILHKEKATSLLVTFKDYVKIESFGLPLSLLDLEIEIFSK